MRASSRSSVWPSTVPTSLPRRRTLTRSLMARTSASLWLMKTTASPSATSERRVANRASTSSGTSTAVGSSRIRIRQSRERALRISTRCCCPIDRFSTRADGSTRIPNRSDASAARRPGGREIEPHAARTAEHQVLRDAHRAHQREVLRDHPDAGRDRVVRRADGQDVALDDDLAVVRQRQPVGDPHGGRLAGPVLAEQGMDLARPHVEVDRVVGDEVTEVLGDPAQLQRRRGALGHCRRRLRVGDGRARRRALVDVDTERARLDLGLAIGDLGCQIIGDAAGHVQR